MTSAVKRASLLGVLTAALLGVFGAALPAAALAAHWTFGSRSVENEPGTSPAPQAVFSGSNVGHPSPFVDSDERPGGFQCDFSGGVRTSTKTVYYEFNVAETGGFAVAARSAAFDPHIVLGVFAADGTVRTETCAAEENAEGNVVTSGVVAGEGDRIIVALGAASDCSVTQGAFEFGAAFVPPSGRRRLERRLGSGPAANAAQSRCNGNGGNGDGTGITEGDGGDNGTTNLGRINAAAKLTPGSYLKLRGRRYVKLGIKSRKLVVSKVPSGATVEVTCSRRACRRYRAVSSGRPLRISTLRNRKLRTGVKVEVRVTQPGRVGRYISYRIKPNDFSKSERCLPVGSRTPQRKC